MQAINEATISGTVNLKSKYIHFNDTVEKNLHISFILTRWWNMLLGILDLWDK